MRQMSTFVAVAFLSLAAAARAEVKVAGIFGDGMVLQQGMPLKVWGWASPGESIVVSFASDKAQTIADEKGEWKLELPPQQASTTPSKLIVTGANEIVLNNVLVGEVWLCSGQSNMAMGFKRCFTNDAEAKAAAAVAGNPAIRLLHVNRNTSHIPLHDLSPKDKWMICTPEVLLENLGEGGFSAVAYYFARELNKELKVPVGVICAAWSGTAIENWTPKEGFEQYPSLKEANFLVQVEDPTSVLRKTLLDKYIKDLELYVQEARIASDTKTVLKRLPPSPGQVVPGGMKEKDIGTNRPTYLFNAMISPLIPFQIRGVIWYQGEANHRDGALYTEKTKAHVAGLRQLWCNPSRGLK